MKDYYRLLGIGRNSDVIAVRKAYRKLALMLHPDVNKAPDAHQRFIELNEAYEVLKKPKLKHQYDRLYDFQIHKKKPKRHRTYQRHEDKWSRNVNRSSEKGKQKGEKYSYASYHKFENRASFWSFFDAFLLVLELIMYVLEFILFW